MDEDVSLGEIVREGLRAAAASGDDAVLGETAQATGAWSEELAGQATQSVAQRITWTELQFAVRAQALDDDATHQALLEGGHLGELGLERHDDKLAGYEAQVLSARSEDAVVAALDAVPSSVRHDAWTREVLAHVTRLGLDGSARVMARRVSNNLLGEVTADVEAFAARGQLARVRTALLRLGHPYQIGHLAGRAAPGWREARDRAIFQA